MREPVRGRLDCVVVGGGMTGLSAAHRLVELGREQGVPVHLRVLEHSDRVGGQIRTERVGEYLIEGGPDSLVAQKPAAMQLAERIGLGDDLVPLGGRYAGTEVVRNGRPVRVPDGFLMMAPTRPWPALRSSLFSLRGKLRMACEPWIAPRPPGEDDESVASFVTRRFGREVLERVAEPIVGSLYTARAEDLSLRLTFPRFLDLETREGSVLRGLRKAAAGPGNAARAGFVALNGGLGRLVEALVRQLPGDAIETGAPVEAITRDDASGAWRVRCADGRVLASDAVLLACPASGSARIVRPFDPNLASSLTRLDYASCATVTLAYPRSSIGAPLRSFGFFVPRIENLPILACSYVSHKFEDRGPKDAMVLRAFVGGAANPAVLEHDDASLVALVHATLARILSLRQAPVFTRLHRFPGSMPQYRPGHAEWIAGIRGRAEEHPGLFFAGSTMGARGLPDCTQSGEGSADLAFSYLAHRERRLPVAI